MSVTAAIISSLLNQSPSTILNRPLDWSAFSSSVLIEVKRGQKIYTCSGVLISKNVVLTAAHCVDEITRGRVIFDISYDPDTDNSIEIESYVMHDGYDVNNSNYAHDIALIFLKRHVSHISPATIYAGPMIDTQAQLGRIGFGGRANRNVRTWTNPSMVQLQDMGHTMVLNDHFSVIGDSGGPIYRMNGNQLELVAVHSTLEGDDKTYAVYLPNYLSWIERYL